MEAGEEVKVLVRGEERESFPAL